MATPADALYAAVDSAMHDLDRSTEQALFDMLWAAWEKHGPFTGHLVQTSPGMTVRPVLTTACVPEGFVCAGLIEAHLSFEPDDPRTSAPVFMGATWLYVRPVRLWSRTDRRQWRELRARLTAGRPG